MIAEILFITVFLVVCSFRQQTEKKCNCGRNKAISGRLASGQAPTN